MSRTQKSLSSKDRRPLEDIVSQWFRFNVHSIFLGGPHLTCSCALLTDACGIKFRVLFFEKPQFNVQLFQRVRNISTAFCMLFAWFEARFQKFVFLYSLGLRAVFGLWQTLCTHKLLARMNFHLFFLLQYRPAISFLIITAIWKDSWREFSSSHQMCWFVLKSGGGMLHGKLLNRPCSSRILTRWNTFVIQRKVNQ